MSQDQTAAGRCAWCEATAPAGATTCPACGAALAQREDLGGLTIPGVTSVHPELAAAAVRPLRIPGQSQAQGLASGVIAGVAMPGAAGLVVAGGVVALAAVEYLGVPGSGLAAPDLPSVGRPSEAALQVAARLDAQAGRPDPARPEPDSTGREPDSTGREPDSAGRDPGFGPR